MVVMSLPQMVVTASVLTLAYVASYIFYNLFLHPLRKYPGPLLGRATILAMQKNTITGDLAQWMHSLHKQYGPVVRYAPNEISYIDASLVKDVYSHRGNSFEKQKDFYGPDPFGEDGLIRANNPSHARQRKLVSHAFSDKALREQEPLLKKYVELLVEKLKEKADAGEALDIVRWYNYTTFDIMADLTFGEPLRCLEGSDYTPWVASIFGGIKQVAMLSVIRRWKLLDRTLKNCLPKKARDERKAHLDHSATRVDKRLDNETDRPDIWTFVMRHSGMEDEKEKSLSRLEMYSNASTFMLAGTETTATELSGMTYYLLKNPEKMERLKKEIRGAFKTMADIHVRELSELKYLNACIEEGLRCYPPVPTGLPRTVPKEGARVNGDWLPGGTTVGLAHFAAYHSEYNFKNPDSYIPERWLPEGEAEYGSDKKEVFNPFSSGPRNCVGKNLAYHEMRLMCAAVLLNFDLELAETEVWPDQKMFILWEKGPLMVKLTPVKA